MAHFTQGKKSWKVSDELSHSDSGSTYDELLSTIKTSLDHTEAKKYADYILQRNESFKRKAENKALEQLKAAIGRKAVRWQEKKTFTGGRV